VKNGKTVPLMPLNEAAV